MGRKKRPTYLTNLSDAYKCFVREEQKEKNKKENRYQLKLREKKEEQVVWNRKWRQKTENYATVVKVRHENVYTEL